MNEASEQRDLVKSPNSALLLWCLPITVILLTGSWLRDGWIVTLSWTLSLVVMGAGCLVNASGCGRMHCYFTGPFFLFMAVVSSSYGLGLLPLGPRGWQYIGAVLLAGGVLLFYVPEWIWGRYRRGHAGTGEC